MTKKPKVGFQSEINVTPLVDVVLVLLIIFMVLVPVTLRGYDVEIPVATTDRQPVAQIVLGIDPDTCPVVELPETAGLPDDCRVRLNEQQVAVQDLGRRIEEIFGERRPTDRVLFLAAHDELNYEGVMRIMDLAKSRVAGLRIGFVTEKRPA